MPDDKFTPLQKKHIATICDGFASLQGDLKRKFSIDTAALKLDSYRVAQIAVKVEMDYLHMANYYGITPNRHKEAGALTYWMCKKKPVNIANAEMIYATLPYLGHKLDEYLALTCSISLIRATNEERLRVEKEQASGQGKPVHPFHSRKLNIGQMKVSVYDFLHNLQNGNLTSLSLAMQYYYIDVTAANDQYLDFVQALTTPARPVTLPPP